jgi:hypothetical protein
MRASRINGHQTFLVRFMRAALASGGHRPPAPFHQGEQQSSAAQIRLRPGPVTPNFGGMTRRKDLWSGEPALDIEGLTSPDTLRRARAVRSLCPCRGDWNAYGEHLQELRTLQKDPDNLVRLNALHVARDAFVGEVQEERRARSAEAAERRDRAMSERNRQALWRASARRR